MSYNFNLATWGSDLNCMKDCKFPVSYSLQSVTMKSPEKDAGGLVSLTLRTPGEIRCVERQKPLILLTLIYTLWGVHSVAMFCSIFFQKF